MPTGYTAKIENGQSFEDFALGCARAFGACLMQRDDPSGDKPKLNEESSYHENRLLEVEAELGAFQTMDRAQQAQAGKELRDEAIANAHKYLNDKLALKAKYEGMKAQVHNWNPPTPDHDNLKQFMIEQLDKSIDFDCNIQYSIDEIEKATKKSETDYYNEKVSSLQWSVNYHEENLHKDAERVERNNQWIRDLYESLGIALD